MIPPIRRSSLLLFSIAVCLGVVCAARCLSAQSFDATNLRQPADLAATWLVHDGDDPAYARPDFDDSQWTRFDSTTSLHKVISSSDPRVVWYRLHVKVSPAQLGLALVGAIRGVAAFTREPAEMLANLNERLVGRAGAGFATALAAHIAADGRVTVANAGHLSPYLDGREVELAGALPLGVKSRTRYETKHFYLGEGGRLTFYSDGLVEAQNQRGELLGFDRGEELSVQPAVEIVEAAKSFGQRDNITVVAITRDSLIANAA